MHNRAHERHSHRHDSRGFTLVELVLVLVVLTVLALTVHTVLLESMRVYAGSVSSLDATYHRDLALERLQRDLRALAGPGSVSHFEQDRLEFETVDGTRVEYRLSGDELERNGEPIAVGVSDFSFEYLTEDSEAASTPGELHLVGIHLEVSRPHGSARASSMVFPRRQDS